MTLSQLLTLAANRLDDTKEPYLWSDEELTSYANQRINKICEEVPAIRDDSTVGICTIPVTAGLNTYATDPRIIYIVEARLNSEVWPLGRMGYQELISFQSTWRSVSNTPRSFITDFELDRILLYPKPIVNDTLYLNVIRYPLEPLDYLRASTMIPEIPARLHELLIPGITAQAYRKADAETENLVRSKEDEKEWLANLEQIRQFYLNLHYTPMVAVPHQAFM
jgi:hypothetical protein